MQLILLRHAHRDQIMMESDNGLSLRGREQAENLATDLIQETYPLPTLCITSPKKRAMETLGIVAKTLRLQTKVDANLDERKSTESHEIFRSRVKQFLNSIHKDSIDTDIIYACSHMDWLEEAYAILGYTLDRGFQYATPILFQRSAQGWKVK